MEVSNVKSMRDALSDSCYAMFNFLKTQNGGYVEMANALDKAKAALAKPPRNCDIGTPEEQSARFDAHCGKNMGCLTCPLREKDGCVPKHCELAWAQMPYEEGSGK